MKLPIVILLVCSFKIDCVCILFIDSVYELMCTIHVYQVGWNVLENQSELYGTLQGDSQMILLVMWEKNVYPVN